MAAALCLALALMLRDRLVPAGVVSLGGWVALGAVAASVAERPLPADLVLRRIAAGRGTAEMIRSCTISAGRESDVRGTDGDFAGGTRPDSKE